MSMIHIYYFSTSPLCLNIEQYYQITRTYKTRPFILHSILQPMNPSTYKWEECPCLLPRAPFNLSEVWNRWQSSCITDDGGLHSMCHTHTLLCTLVNHFVISQTEYIWVRWCSSSLNMCVCSLSCYISVTLI